MRGKTHLVFGLTLGLYFLIVFNLSPLFLFFVLLGSLFPDIDTPSSKLGKKFKLVGWVFQHRGFFHSFLAVGLLSAVFYSFFSVAGLGFLLGAMSHLALDMLTPAGVRLHPFKFKIRGPFKTGGVVDSTLFFSCVILSGWFILNLAF